MSFKYLQSLLIATESKLSIQSDWLSSLLAILSMRGRFETSLVYQNNWHVVKDAMPVGEIPFYIILEGVVALKKGHASAQPLFAGDIVLLPHRGAHSLRQTPQAKVLSGTLTVAQPHEWFFRKYLPEIMIARASDAEGFTTSQLKTAVSMIRTEFSSEKPGAPMILAPLAPVLFVISFRILSGLSEPPKGLLAAAACEKLAPVLEGLFTSPSKNWTLEEFAALCGISRATMLRHFQRTLGCSPMELLQDIRMAVAANELMTRDGSTAEVAHGVGYKSVSAFRRVFVAHFGVTPLRWRRTAPQSY